MMNAKNSNDAANRLLYIFIAIGILPLLMIWGIYLYNPYSPLLNSIAVMTDNLPAVMSAANPVMSKVMDVYCKTAPFWAFILFACSIKVRRVINTASRNIMIRACILSPFFYIAFIYLFLFRNLELTTAGGPVRLMSGHDILLLFFYMGFYFLIFLLSYGMYYVLVIAYKLFKERR